MASTTTSHADTNELRTMARVFLTDRIRSVDLATYHNHGVVEELVEMLRRDDRRLLQELDISLEVHETAGNATKATIVKDLTKKVRAYLNTAPSR